MLQKSGPIWNAICLDSKVSFCLLFIYDFFIADYTINLTVIFERVFVNTELHPIFGRGRHFVGQEINGSLVSLTGSGATSLVIAPAGFFGPRGPKTRGGTLGLPA